MPSVVLVVDAIPQLHATLTAALALDPERLDLWDLLSAPSAQVAEHAAAPGSPFVYRPGVAI
ncbi:MAG: hypothetical protein R2867_27670 [Caldilineaceae bacterium]